MSGRIRTIKPEFWRHEDLSALPEATHMLAAALLNYADDEGYFNANPKLVQAECCPLREPSVTVHDSLIDLSKIGYIRLGTGGDGRSYGHITHFLDHQRINRAKPSKIKLLNIVWDESVNNHTHVSDPSPPEQGTGNREGEQEYSVPDGTGSADAPPDPRDVLFSEGLQTIRTLTGTPERQARSLLGRWLKLTGDDASAVLMVLRDAGDARPADPVAWIERSFKPRDGPNKIFTLEDLHPELAGQENG